MNRQRLRIRFSKQGDLRFISHRDLVRAFERLFRRADMPLQMSEGFHPKAKMTFPSALALGVEARDEVMEFELAEALPSAEVAERLQAKSPEGLTILSVTALEAGQKKARVEKMWYEFPIPADRVEHVQREVENLMAMESLLKTREGSRKPIDLRANILRLAVEGNHLRLCLQIADSASVRPRDILDIVNLANTESDGAVLIRTSVELAS